METVRTHEQKLTEIHYVMLLNCNKIGYTKNKEYT